MSLITNNISGSSSGNWQIGMTGSVVISDRPTVATFPLLPGDVSLFIDGTKRTVVKGDSTFSGSIVASGSTILAGAVSLAGNSQTVTHTGTGDLTISSNNGTVVIEGTIFNSNDVVVAGDLAVNGGDVFTSAATFNLIESNAANINIGGNSQTVKIGNSTAGTGQTVVRNMLSVSGTNGISTLGNVTLNSTSARSITHVGASGQNLTITSTSGDVLVEGTTFSGNNVTVPGTINANGGSIATNQTTFTIAGATATTLNVGSAATTLKMGAPGVTLNIGNVLTGTTSLVTVKGDLQIDGNNIKSTGGTYTPITLSSTTNNTTLNGNLYVGDGSAGSGGGDIILQPSLSPVNSADIITTSTTANLFSADASGGLGTATVNVGKSGGTNKVVIGNILKVGGNKILSSGDYEAITLSSTSRNTFLNGILFVGDAASGGGDIVLRPQLSPTVLSCDIQTTSTTANVFASDPAGGLGTSTVNIGRTGSTNRVNVGGYLKVIGNVILNSNGDSALTMDSASPHVTVGGQLTIGDLSTSGAGDIYQKPPSTQASDIISTAATANIYADAGSTTTINLGTQTASTVNLGKTGTANTLNVGGVLLVPSQTSFMAISGSSGGTVLTLTPTTSGNGDKIQFDTEIFDIGGGYAPGALGATSTFTAPKTGKYYLSTAVRIGTLDVASSYYALRLITSNNNYLLDIKSPGGMTGAVANWTLMGSVVTDMDASDTAQVYVQQYSGTGSKIIASGNSTYFCGYLLG